MGGLTNFPNGISSFGVAQLAGSGIPFTGQPFFVDPVNGIDGNSGKSVDRALKTLSRAHDLMTDGANDVAYLIGNGETAAGKMNE